MSAADDPVPLWPHASTVTAKWITHSNFNDEPGTAACAGRTNLPCRLVALVQVLPQVSKPHDDQGIEVLAYNPWPNDDDGNDIQINPAQPAPDS